MTLVNNFILITVKLECKPDRMYIHGSSSKMISGTLKAKNNRRVYCEKKFRNAYEFGVEMPYDECGTHKTVSTSSHTKIFPHLGAF